MKIKSSSLTLIVAIFIFALTGIGFVVWNIRNVFRPSGSFEFSLMPGVAIVVAEYIAMVILYMIIAFNLYKLARVGRDKEIISRKNLARVKRIQYILVVLLLLKAAVVLIMTAVFMRSATGVALQLIGIIKSSWELLAGMLIIYILANVFERAVILKEEEALTI
jgi:hypothetical protein